MNCDHLHHVLDAYLDHELDDSTRTQLAQHLGSCPGCLALHDERVALGSALRALPAHGAPDRLRTAIIDRLIADDRARAQRLPRKASLWKSVLSAGAAAMVSFVLGFWVARPPDVTDGRDQYISLHAASLADDLRSIQVRSTDRHVVKPWFAGKLDFAPPVRSLSDQGFELIGASIDSVGGRPTAAVVYRIRQHDITLFVSRTPDLNPAPPVASTLRGFSVVHWAADGMSFSAVSDLEPAELRRFAMLVREPPQ